MQYLSLHPGGPWGWRDASRRLLPPDVRFRAYFFLLRAPALGAAYVRLRKPLRSSAVTGRTALVIDGFPRSANSFARLAFQEANGPDVRIATNLHTPRAVERAHRLGLPSIVLIRDPRDAVSSLLQMRFGIRAETAINYYLLYYRRLLPLMQHLVVADFDEVTSDFGAVIRRCNAAYGTTFNEYDSSAEATRRIFHGIDALVRSHHNGALVEDRVSRPSAYRSPTHEFLKTVPDSGVARLDEAVALWQEIRARHTEPAEPDALAPDQRPAPAYGASPHYDAAYFRWQDHAGSLVTRYNVRYFTPHVDKDDVVLDFGCGGGGMLTALQCTRRLGVDINPVARAAAASRGVEVHRTLEEIPDGIADVAISSHALEHVTQPFEALRQVRAKLRPGGRLVLVLPIDDWRRPYDPDDINRHLYTWTPLLLGHLLNEAGFTVRGEDIQVFRHSLMRGFRILDRALPVALFDVACRTWARLRHARQLVAVAHRPGEPARSPARQQRGQPTHQLVGPPVALRHSELGVRQPGVGG